MLFELYMMLSVSFFSSLFVNEFEHFRVALSCARASSQVFLLYLIKIKITLIGEYQKLTDVNGKSRVFRINKANGSSGLSICHTDDSGNLIIFDTICSLCFVYKRGGEEEEEEEK